MTQKECKRNLKLMSKWWALIHSFLNSFYNLTYLILFLKQDRILESTVGFVTVLDFFSELLFSPMHPFVAVNDTSRIYLFISPFSNVSYIYCRLFISIHVIQCIFVTQGDYHDYDYELNLRKQKRALKHKQIEQIVENGVLEEEREPWFMRVASHSMYFNFENVSFARDLWEDFNVSNTSISNISDTCHWMHCINHFIPHVCSCLYFWCSIFFNKVVLNINTLCVYIRIVKYNNPLFYLIAWFIGLLYIWSISDLDRQFSPLVKG